MNPDPASLDRLHDVMAPPTVPWWPPAAGWLWLGSFLLATAIVVSLQAWMRHQANGYRREALTVLNRHEAALRDADPERSAAAIAGMAELLKRAALTVWPRRVVASLRGDEWTSFLNRTGGGKPIPGGVVNLMETVAADSRKAAGPDAAALRDLTDAVRQWLAWHRVEEPPEGDGKEEPC